MQNRIDRLESLVLSLMTNGSQAAGPAAAIEAISGNSSSIGSQHTTDLDVDVDEDASGGPEESDTEQVTKSFGIMKVDNNKSYYFSEAHWASVLNDIAEVRNYFSTHKKQYEEQAEKLKTNKLPTDVPGSTLLFGAMKSTSRAEIMSSLPSKYTTDILVARYFNSYDPSTIWIGMLCAIMRLAMLSYHREGDEPPEFRGKTLDMAGTFRNLMAQCLTLADYTKPYPSLIESLIFHLHGDFIQTKDADVSVWVLVGVITRLAMRMGYHRDSKMFPNITPFQGEMRRRVWTIVRQYDLMFSFQVGLPTMIRSSDTDTDLPRNLYDDDFDENCKELPSPRPPNEPTPISCLIAKGRLTYAFGRVIELASSIQTPSYDRVMEIDAELRQARDLVPEHLLIRPVEDTQMESSKLVMSRYARSKEIWDELLDDAMEAWKASGALGVMLARLNLVPPESNPAAPTFEPQDEKQSAAMTLGLLSSGMSPMNPGPSAFNDGTIKMGETPLPTQGTFGTTADIAGAPSPLSAMFGQMPDMQLNLDWDAWDNYIQNAAVDVPSQWWPTMDAQQQQQQPQNPLGSTGLPSVQVGAADKMRSLPPFANVFYPETNAYDNNNPPPNNAAPR
ncbi:hypothetical protein BBP40_007765 [Aspergillus hancockii]|nr:hypothetical protein BBP40_007765 [Aspergillus hancockii]